MGHVIGRPVCVMVLLAVVGAARADDYHMLNVTWPQTCGWDGAYRPGRWLPLELLITGDVNLKKPLNCRLTLSLQQDSMTDMTVTHNFVATPNVNTYLPMAVPLRHNASTFDAKITDDADRTHQEHQFYITNLQAVPQDELFIGLVCGSTPTGLWSLPGQIEPGGHRARSERRAKRRRTKPAPWSLPPRERRHRRAWRPAVGLDRLRLPGPVDPQRHRLGPAQRHAGPRDRQLGQQGREAADGAGRSAVASQARAFRAAAAGAGQVANIPVTATQLAAWEMRHVTKKSFACWTIPAAANWTSLKLENGQPYFACGPVGFGKVGVVGLNPADLVDKAPAGKFSGADPGPVRFSLPRLDQRGVPLAAAPTDDAIRQLRAGRGRTDQ